MKKIAAAFIVLMLLATARPGLAAPYQAQAPRAELGKIKISLSGPPAFVRIDGLDRHLDDILLATQSPRAAVLAIYAGPEAWKAFQANPSADPSSNDRRGGLSLYAVISTPGPLAAETVSTEMFETIKKDLKQNLKKEVGQKRLLEKELAGVSDHQVESARGLMESFDPLDEEARFLTYRMASSLELKLKNVKTPSRSRSVVLSSTLLLSGKIINLQIISNGDSQTDLEEAARRWRADFIKKNQPK